MTRALAAAVTAAVMVALLALTPGLATADPAFPVRAVPASATGDPAGDDEPSGPQDEFAPDDDFAPEDEFAPDDEFAPLDYDVPDIEGLTLAPRGDAELAESNAVKPDVTVEYMTDLLMDVYRVEAEQAPWVLFVHGGYWSAGSRLSHGALPTRFQAAGFAVFAVEYRLAGDEFWPAQRDDVLVAVDWVRDNAEEFGIDPDRGVLIGSSAGGHIALSAAFEGAQVRGVVSLSGILSPYAAWKSSHRKADPSLYRLGDGAVLLMGCSPWEYKGECWKKWQAATPRYTVTAEAPPILLVASRKDKLVKPSIAKAVCTAAKKVAVPCSISVYAGSAHGLTIFRSKYARIINWVATRTQ